MEEKLENLLTRNTGNKAHQQLYKMYYYDLSFHDEKNDILEEKKLWGKRKY